MSFGYYHFLSFILGRIDVLEKTTVPLHLIGKLFIVTINFFKNCEQKIQVRNTIHMYGDTDKTFRPVESFR